MIQQPLKTRETRAKRNEETGKTSRGPNPRFAFLETAESLSYVLARTLFNFFQFIRLTMFSLSLSSSPWKVLYKTWNLYTTSPRCGSWRGSVRRRVKGERRLKATTPAWKRCFQTLEKRWNIMCVAGKLSASSRESIKTTDASASNYSECAESRKIIDLTSHATTPFFIATSISI